MEEGKAKIIAEGLKMRASPLFFGKVADGDREVFDRNPRPSDFYGDLDIKIHPIASYSEAPHRIERIDAKADHRIADLPSLTDLEVDPDLRESTRAPPEGRGGFIVFGIAKNRGLGRALRMVEETRNRLEIVLAITINLKGMCEAVFRSRFKPRFDRRALSTVLSPAHDDGKAFSSDAIEDGARLGPASIIDDNHSVEVRFRSAYNGFDRPRIIVRGDENAGVNAAHERPSRRWTRPEDASSRGVRMKKSYASSPATRSSNSSSSPGRMRPRNFSRLKRWMVRVSPRRSIPSATI